MNDNPTADPGQQDSRERLMGAALELFTQRGYSAASVREICAAAGVTKPVLYYYFDSKERLYLDLLDGAYHHFESRVADLSSFAGSVRERVIHFCEGVFDTCMEQLPVVRLIYSISFGTPQGAPHFNLEQYYDRMLTIVAGLVQDGVRSGELRDGNAADMVWAIMSCLNTAIEEQMCHRQPRVDRAAMSRMLGLLFNGMAR